MNRQMDMVQVFHEKHGFPVGIPIGHDPKTDLIRGHLIAEELGELMLALANRDLRQVADSLGDLAYVIVGTAVVYGVPLREVFEAIHVSNMTKAVRDPADTRLRNKGDSYVPPFIQQALDRGASRPQPRVICLCGSTKFREAFERANMEETLKGHVVLSVGCYGHGTSAKSIWLTSEQKVLLDELHKRKIDMADEVLVLNVNGYIGESTRSEIEYATQHGKPVRYLEAMSC